MKYFILAFIVLSSLSSYAQDLTLTQKTGNVNRFNPSLTGVNSSFGVQLNYRNQWPSLPGNFAFSSLLVNYNLKNNLGFGLEINDDRAGNSLFKANELKANMNYAFELKDVEVRSGLNIGYGQRVVSWDKLRFEDQIDPSQGFVRETAEQYSGDPAHYMVVDFGASAYYKGFFVGASGIHLNQPNVSLFESEIARMPIRYVGMVGYHKSFKDINIGALVTYQHQNTFSLFDYQVTGQYKVFKLGYGYRDSYGYYQNPGWHTGSLGVQFDKFAVGYSYDYINIGGARHSHEATAAWYIKGLNREKGMNKFLNSVL
ncbi:MAG: PorP/SprF family type IX secretion system membrane protein [Bacteroidia bacterium]